MLTIINYINAHANDPSLPPPPAASPPFYDVDDDGLCRPGDVLLVINYINNHGTVGGEGEGVSRATTAREVAFPVTHDEGAVSGSVNVQFVPASSPGPQTAGVRFTSRARDTSEAVSASARTRRTANFQTPTGPRLTTESTAGPPRQALVAGLETWEDAVADELAALLAQDIGRSAW